MRVGRVKSAGTLSQSTVDSLMPRLLARAGLADLNHRLAEHDEHHTRGPRSCTTRFGY